MEVACSTVAKGGATTRWFAVSLSTAMASPSLRLGDTGHLNSRPLPRYAPASVWTYKLGGYQVLKKLVSYRERTGRPLTEREAPCFRGVARRIVALLRVGAGIEGVTP